MDWNELLQACDHFLNRLWEYPITKTITGFLVWILYILYGDFRPAYLGVISIICLDWATGLYYSWANPKLKMDLNKLRQGAIKLLIYGLLLALGHFCSLVEIMASFQALIEGYIFITESISVVKHFHEISILHNTEIAFLNKLIKLLNGKQESLGGDQE
jgi:hypothetical protein